MIFRLSQKLNTKIKAGVLHTTALDKNPYADWSAHLFMARRTQYILLSNTSSLYSTVMYGKGITNERQFIDRALNCIRDFMQDDGQKDAYQQFVAPATGTIRFGKALNRSVTGSMNELIFHAILWLTEGGYSPHKVSFKLNDILISSLAGPNDHGYGRPREAFEGLIVRS